MFVENEINEWLTEEQFGICTRYCIIIQCRNYILKHKIILTIIIAMIKTKKTKLKIKMNN